MIYQALGNFEGQAEVSFQRGFLFDQMSKLRDARQHLQRALELGTNDSERIPAGEDAAETRRRRN